MPSFVHPALLWGLAIIALPVLIHLINLVRQRRVQWAAMEFLLHSQRKNSTWVRLKELLLMLLRMAAIAAVVLALAEPLLHREIGLRLGSHHTHHVVLLDDSFSMADRWADTSAFERARQTVRRIGDDAAQHNSPQSFTLLRFSAAQPAGRASQPDMLQETVGSDFGSRLSVVLDRLQPSQAAIGPGPALAAAEQLVGPDHGDSLVLYLISDFRAREWNEPGELVKSCQRLNERGFRLELVQCVESAHANLAITSLRLTPGAKAAGVPLNMEVTVKNYGNEKAREVSLTLEEDSAARSGLIFDEIGPRQSENLSFPVLFGSAGEHAVAAHLASDAVATDNHRFLVVDLPVTVPVLIVDGDAQSTGGRFLTAALAPGGVKTGLDPRIEPSSFLNNNPLAKFHTIFLCDVPRLDHAAVDALEKFVRDGGGLGIFLGPQCQVGWYNQDFYRGGEGAFPVPLAGATQLLVDRLDKAPDLEATDHPIFRVFLGERAKFLSAVTIERFFAVPPDWKPTLGGPAQVIAQLRNGAPFTVEREFGAGRVVAMLSTAAPEWNNWGRNPSFVVAVLEMQAHLDRRGATASSQQIGSPIAIQLDPARFEPHLKLIPPADDPLGPRTLEAAEGPQGLSFTLPDTTTSGTYELQLASRDNTVQVRRFAVNVDPDEGDLQLVDGEQLGTRLKGVKYEYRQASEFTSATHELAGSNLTDAMLYLLVAILVGEQLLAYSASYHTRAREGRHA
jgi:hypothetical protein